MMKHVIAALVLCAIALPVAAGEDEMVQVPRSKLEALAQEHADALKLLDEQDKIIDEQLKRIRQLQTATNCV